MTVLSHNTQLLVLVLTIKCDHLFSEELKTKIPHMTAWSDIKHFIHALERKFKTPRMG